MKMEGFRFNSLVFHSYLGKGRCCSLVCLDLLVLGRLQGRRVSPPIPERDCRKIYPVFDPLFRKSESMLSRCPRLTILRQCLTEQNVLLFIHLLLSGSLGQSCVLQG